MATAATAIDALRLLKQQRFDAVFADIQMPGLSGLELVQVLNEFDEPPAVVFVTAYEEYALRAFELRAVDYSSSPSTLDRLRETLERLHGGRAAPRPRPLEPAPARVPRPRQAARRDGRPHGPRRPGRDPLAEARDNVVYVRTYDRVYATRFSLHELERRLPTPPFLRIHRAFLANMRNVVEIRPYFNGTYLLKVNDATATDLTVSRGRVKDMRTLPDSSSTPYGQVPSSQNHSPPAQC